MSRFIARISLFSATAAALLWGATLSATVSFVGNDPATDAGWRTAGTVKPNDLDGDNIYGTAGYFLAAGKRAGFVAPFLSGTHILTTHADGINTLPSYLLSLEYTNPDERGRSWGGSGGNFGTLDTVPGSTGLTGATILLEAAVADPMSLTLQRLDSPAFRLTLILGHNPNEGPFSDPMGQTVTVDDGSGPVTQVTGDASLGSKTDGYTTYQSWDISAGSSDITIVLQGLPDGTGIARLSGIAIDTLLVTPPTIEAQPVGGTFLVGTPLTLTVSAGGSPGTYQWFKDDVALPGATASSLSFPSLQSTDSGVYQVVASNAAGTDTSDAMTVSVMDALPQQLIDYQAAVRSEPTLVSYYTFDGLDAQDSETGYHGTSQGQTFFGEGMVGGAAKALLLTGAGHVNLGQVDAFDFLGDVGTIEAWVRADWVSNPGHNPALFADRTDPQVNWSIHMMQNKEQIAFWNGSRVSTVSIPNAGTDWHHLAVTFEYGVWSVYWNGELAGSDDQLFGIEVSCTTQLGSASPTGQERWIGALDEVAFYSEALSAEAIRRHYEAYLAAAPPAIVTSPQGGTFLPGIALTLSVDVQGVNLSYQWFKGDTALAGATGATLQLPGLEASDAGSYHVVVSNPNGSAASAPAAIAVADVVPGRLVNYRNAVFQQSSLVGYYAFDALDANDSKGGHHGSLMGVTRFEDGVGAGADKALALAGQGHVNFGQVDDFDFMDGTGTIALFVRAEWIGSPGYNPVIVADRDMEWGLINYSVNLSADKTQLIFFDGAVAQTSNLPLPAGAAWHWLAVVFNGANSACYWNGQPVGNFDATYFGGSPESPTQLGSASPAGELRWVGALDEVAFFADSLSAGAVQALYNAFMEGELPTIAVQPQGATLLAGSPLNLLVEAQGANLTFQWYRDGAAIPGATSGALSFSALTADDTGTYVVRITNPAGSLDSEPAAVRVIVPDLAEYQSVVRQEPSLISYYTFDTHDASDSKSTNHGSFEGDAQSAPGVGSGADRSVLLGGDGYVSLGPVDAFDFADGQGSIAAWVRADWTSSPGYNPTIFADRDQGVGVNWSIHMMNEKGRIAHWNGSRVALVNIPNAGNSWHHLVTTFDANTWSVYWNGELAGTDTQVFGTSPEVATQLGSAMSASAFEGWIGALDEVAFYSAPLSADTVRRHYQALVGVPAEPPTLVVERGDNQITISWPTAVAGFTLESADELAATTWTSVDGVENNRVTVSSASGARFYRLRGL